MFQEVSKWLVNGLYPTINVIYWGSNQNLLLTSWDILAFRTPHEGSYFKVFQARTKPDVEVRAMAGAVAKWLALTKLIFATKQFQLIGK